MVRVKEDFVFKKVGEIEEGDFLVVRNSQQIKGIYHCPLRAALAGLALGNKKNKEFKKSKKNRYKWLIPNKGKFKPLVYFLREARLTIKFKTDPSFLVLHGLDNEFKIPDFVIHGDEQTVKMFLVGYLINYMQYHNTYETLKVEIGYLTETEQNFIHYAITCFGITPTKRSSRFLYFDRSRLPVIEKRMLGIDLGLMKIDMKKFAYKGISEVYNNLIDNSLIRNKKRYHRKQFVRWNAIKRILGATEHLSETKSYKLLDRVLNGGYRLAEVKSKRLIGKEICYDLSIDNRPQYVKNFGGRPHYLANGIISHNTETQARRVTFTEVWNRFLSPFNRDYFPPNPRYKTEIDIDVNDTNVFAGTSSELSALGYNLYGGIIDEVNFLQVIEDSKKSPEGVYDAAEEMLTHVEARMASRFMKQGRIPGFVACSSSRVAPDDFTERKIKEAMMLGEDSRIFFAAMPLWEAKGKKFYSFDDFFYIDTETLEVVDESEGKILYTVQELLRKEKAGVEVTTMDIGIGDLHLTNKDLNLDKMII
jgi:hypothetical protein